MLLDEERDGKESESFAEEKESESFGEVAAVTEASEADLGTEASEADLSTGMPTETEMESTSASFGEVTKVVTDTPTETFEKQVNTLL